jgi:hypothetical protein
MQFQSQKSRMTKFIKGYGKKFLNAFILLMLIVIGFLGFWFALRMTLNTECPLLPVSSGNMCIVQPQCDGLSYPFEPTLHVGDLIIVQGVDARNVEVAYPESDVIVFYMPKLDSYQKDELIITRVVAKEERDGIVYFRTKSDGEGIHIWPEIPDISECDRWYDYRENHTWNDMISEKLLVGKVILRIPWIGHIALFMHKSSGIFIIIVFMVILIVVGFSIPAFSSEKVEVKQGEDGEKIAET